MSTAPFGFLRVAAACPPVRLADPEKNADAILEFVSKAGEQKVQVLVLPELCLLYTSPSPRDRQKSRMPSSA